MLEQNLSLDGNLPFTRTDGHGYHPLNEAEFEIVLKSFPQVELALRKLRNKILRSRQKEREEKVNDIVGLTKVEVEYVLNFLGVNNFLSNVDLQMGSMSLPYLCLRNGIVRGRLDLDTVDIPGPVDMRGLHAAFLSMRASSLGSVDLDMSQIYETEILNTTILGDLTLRNARTSLLNIKDTRICGNLNLREAQVDRLALNNTKIDGRIVTSRHTIIG